MPLPWSTSQVQSVGIFTTSVLGSIPGSDLLAMVIAVPAHAAGGTLNKLLGGTITNDTGSGPTCCNKQLLGWEINNQVAAGPLR